jgi:hypothetical protein
VSGVACDFRSVKVSETLIRLRSHVGACVILDETEMPYRVRRASIFRGECLEGTTFDSFSNRLGSIPSQPARVGLGARKRLFCFCRLFLRGGVVVHGGLISLRAGATPATATKFVVNVVEDYTDMKSR